MKTKQKAIKVSVNANGWFGYDDLVKAFEDGWRVVRMDYLYRANGIITAQAYILEREDNA